jgi:hypothetical protein
MPWSTPSGSSHSVAPLRLATVYLDDDNVRALLRAKDAPFAAALDRIRGRREWGVKAFAHAQPDVSADPGAADTGLGPGAAYLLRKRMARERGARTQQDVQDAAADLHRTLSSAAAASHLYPPQDPQLSGRREPMVLNPPTSSRSPGRPRSSTRCRRGNLRTSSTS